MTCSFLSCAWRSTYMPAGFVLFLLLPAAKEYDIIQLGLPNKVVSP
jgi:hypothetical protein